MNTTDKNYVDRLHNQQVNELNEIKNRLLILEGKPTAMPNGNIRVEIDTEKVYEMFLKACHDCLQQRQERRQEEDRKAAEKLRQECEAKGERYFSNVHEWRAAIARDYDEFLRKMLGLSKIANRRYRDIRSALLKLLGESSTSTNEASKKSFHLFESTLRHLAQAHRNSAPSRATHSRLSLPLIHPTQRLDYTYCPSLLYIPHRLAIVPPDIFFFELISLKLSRNIFDN